MCAVRWPGRPETIASVGGHGGRVWNLDTGQSPLVHGTAGEVARSVCAYLDDGRMRLAMGLADGRILIRDLESGAHLRTLSGHRGMVNGLCTFTAGGRTFLASAGHDGTVGVWDLAAGHGELLTGHRYEVNAVCATSGLLVSAGGDGTVRTWDPSAGAELQVLRRHQGPINDLCTVTTADGRELVASAGGDETVGLWEAHADPSRLDFLRSLFGHTFAVRGVCSFTRDGDTFLASAGGDTVLLWDLATNRYREVGRDDGHIWSVCHVDVDGRPVLASGGPDGTIRLWDVDAATDPPDQETLPAEQLAVAHWPSGKALAIGRGDGKLALWSPDTSTVTYIGQVDGVLDGRLGTVTCQPRDGARRDYLCVAGQGRLVLRYGFGGKKAVGPVALSGIGGRNGAVTEFRGGMLLSYADEHHVFSVYLNPVDLDLLEQDPEIQLDNNRHRLSDELFDINAICNVGGPGFVQVFAASGTQITSWTGYPDGMLDQGGELLEYSPAGSIGVPRTISDLAALWVGESLVLAVTQGPRIDLWVAERPRSPLSPNYRNLTLDGTLNGGAGDIKSLHPFTADDRPMLAAVGADRVVQIWDLNARTGVMSIPFPHRVRSVCFDDGTLYVGLSAGVVAVRLSPEVLHSRRDAEERRARR
ncbi:WD40 repeat domain-containing protein [Actinomadura darangshiensis]